MRGHEHIIAMRKAGQTPEWVFLNDLPCATDWAEFGEHATVSTYDDNVERLDLRFLVGLKVAISATSEKRAMALYESVKAFGAQLIVAGCVQTVHSPWEQAGWCAVWEKPPFQLEAING